MPENRLSVAPLSRISAHTKDQALVSMGLFLISVLSRRGSFAHDAIMADTAMTSKMNGVVFMIKSVFEN